MTQQHTPKTMKYRGVVWAKTIVVGNNAKEFYNDMKYSIEQLETAAQAFGWGMVEVSENGDDVPSDILTAVLPADYRPEPSTEVQGETLWYLGNL